MPERGGLWGGGVKANNMSSDKVTYPEVLKAMDRCDGGNRVERYEKRLLELHLERFPILVPEPFNRIILAS